MCTSCSNGQRLNERDFTNYVKINTHMFVLYPKDVEDVYIYNLVFVNISTQLGVQTEKEYIKLPQFLNYNSNVYITRNILCKESVLLFERKISCNEIYNLYRNDISYTPMNCNSISQLIDKYPQLNKLSWLEPVNSDDIAIYNSIPISLIQSLINECDNLAQQTADNYRKKINKLHCRVCHEFNEYAESDKLTSLSEYTCWNCGTHPERYKVGLKHDFQINQIKQIYWRK